ncbi:hypothetical protein [Hymenobacter cellulosivorans]|uniref:UDP-N-acetylglucosamine kinase n=1 Tax=Hymenobacter cellulosivorans TaxID=2932249 RepID=A0ABY4FE47_9BACT|nr:hypothetical protein [Hymenobacter cellulosivorans]UOQ54763.1 hypothetical protein MUN80_08385 [Hymenobacter cellulosivorans]
MPTVFILAGPNGAGKTSLYQHEAPTVPRLNGDSLYQQGMHIHDVEAELRKQMEGWVADMASFVIETNAASERDYALFETLKKAGYRLECRYVGLESVLDCLKRVAQRVAEGGHDVPAALIQHRYNSSLSLLKRNYRVFDRLQLYDNSEAQPEELVDFVPGSPLVELQALPDWASAVVKHLIKMEAVYQRLPRK